MDDREKFYNVESVSTSWETHRTLIQSTKSSAVQALKIARKGGSYILRSSLHKATVNHFCCCCMRYIQPGETYEKIIQAMGNGIVEFKTHYNPACDFPEEPIEKHEAMDQEEDIAYKQAA